MLESARPTRNYALEWVNEAAVPRSGGDGLVLAARQGPDHLAGRFLAAAAAIRDREVSLHFVEGGGASADDFLKLAIGNGVTDADVHGC
jgi:hypothetical protein